MLFNGYKLLIIKHDTLFLMLETSHSRKMNGGEFFVDHPRLHRFIAAATEIVRESTDATVKLKRLREPYAELLGDPEWLPDEFKQPSTSTTMKMGFASWLLYRSELKDLSLSTLVVAPGLSTPIHNHLAWGLVGLYQGAQEEEEYDLDGDHHPDAPEARRLARLVKESPPYFQG